jgi:cytidylate kinase
MSYPQTIAIDGPGSAGKTTAGHFLAERLDYLFFDTGSIYRAATWAVQDGGVDIHDEGAVTALAEALNIDILPDLEGGGLTTKVLVNGQDVTGHLHTPDVDAEVSVVAAYAGVRAAMIERQRAIGQRGRVVMMGRDIGTVVLPRADLKIFMTASVESRARRRWEERGRREAYEDVLALLRRRDAIDSGREVAPLRPAEDAFLVDTTDLSLEETLEKIWELVKNWMPKK